MSSIPESNEGAEQIAVGMAQPGTECDQIDTRLVKDFRIRQIAVHDSEAERLTNHADMLDTEGAPLNAIHKAVLHGRAQFHDWRARVATSKLVKLVHHHD